MVTVYGTTYYHLPAGATDRHFWLFSSVHSSGIRSLPSLKARYHEATFPMKIAPTSYYATCMNEITL